MIWIRQLISRFYIRSLVALHQGHFPSAIYQRLHSALCGRLQTLFPSAELRWCAPVTDLADCVFSSPTYYQYLFNSKPKTQIAVENLLNLQRACSLFGRTRHNNQLPTHHHPKQMEGYQTQQAFLYCLFRSKFE